MPGGATIQSSLKSSAVHHLTCFYSDFWLENIPEGSENMGGVDTNQQDPETGRVLGWQSLVLLVIPSGEADGDAVFFAGHGPHCGVDG